MDPFVIAQREDIGAYFVGFQEDSEILQCSRCNVEYRLRYTEIEQGNLAEHRRAAQRVIEVEHPEHGDKIRVR